MNEADTRRKSIVPLLRSAGWDEEPHSINEQRYFTKGRIVRENRAERRKAKRVDYLLRCTLDLFNAAVEAKDDHKKVSDGLQHAKDHAQLLGLKVVYVSNDQEIIQFNFITGMNKSVPVFPKPQELWQRLRASELIEDDVVSQRLGTSGEKRDYCQQLSVTRVQSTLQTKPRNGREIAIRRKGSFENAADFRLRISRVQSLLSVE
jgi:type I restriction enzyme R subunit